MIRVRLEHTFEHKPELVWELIVDPEYYRLWTVAFHEGSFFEGDWTKGSKIRFVSEDESGIVTGMVSTIEENDYPNHISIKHLGLVMNGIEDYDSEYTKVWAPAFENYHLARNEDGGCTFLLEQDMPEDYVEDFKQMWIAGFQKMGTLLNTNHTIGKVIHLHEKSQLSTNAVWDKLTMPEKVMTWNYASDDWHCPKAINDLKSGGEFHYEMASKDGQMSFDFWGTFDEIEISKKLYAILGDGRTLQIELFSKPYGTLIVERFEAEDQNDLNLQRFGWQSILKNLARKDEHS